jgi:hypothetical protein
MIYFNFFKSYIFEIFLGVWCGPTALLGGFASQTVEWGRGSLSRFLCGRESLLPCPAILSNDAPARRATSINARRSFDLYLMINANGKIKDLCFCSDLDMTLLSELVESCVLFCFCVTRDLIQTV